MDEKIKQLEKEIQEIRARNKRVELEKAWETSLLRSVSILVVTYSLVVVVMYFLDIERPFINAIIPTLGYFLSTQTFPFIKKWWIRRRM
jgi:hypothetical protein